MLLLNLNLLFSDPVDFLALALFLVSALLMGITVHEFSHALVAYGLGDSTAKRLGRLSLNPLRHLDPTGTVLLLVAGFGWGKPVPVDPRFFRADPRVGMVLVSLAGPISNLVTASALGLLFRADVLPWIPPGLLGSALFTDISLFLGALLAWVLLLNIVLAIFNLLPIPPLDGSQVVLGLLPPNTARDFARLQQYGIVILMSIIFLDIFLGVGILSRTIGPVIDLVGSVVVGGQFF